MTSLRLSAPDYLVIAGYFVIVLWIGFYFRNRLEATRDFFAGGNQIPWWLAGISHYMSSFSAFAFIAYAQMGYTYGWVAITLFWATIPACVAGGLFFAKRWRRARVITPVQFLETRFNGFVRQLFAWAGIPMKVFDDALKIFATGLFISVSAGVNLYSAIVVCGAVMIVYAFLGGLWALVVTDYVQFVMKTLAMLLLLPLAIVAAGGLDHAFENLPPGFLRLSGGPFGWTYICGFIILMMISYNASWSLAQKYYSVRNEKEASKAAYFAGILNFAGAPLMILPAVIGRHLQPELMAQGRTADVYVLLVMKLLPAGMVGIIITAMFSATMAMVSADFNATAGVLTKDVFERLIRPGASEKQLLRVGRLITVGLGALTTLLSVWIALSQKQTLFSLMVTVLGTFMAPTLLPLLAGLAVRRLTWQGAVAGFGTGLANGLIFLAIKTWWIPSQPSNPFGSTYTFEGISLIANAAATILGMVVGTIASKRSAEESARVEQFFAAVDTPIAEGEVPKRRGNPSAPVLAVSTISVALLIGVAGLISGSATARWIDTGVALALITVGVSFWRSATRTTPTATLE